MRPRRRLHVDGRRCLARRDRLSPKLGIGVRKKNVFVPGLTDVQRRELETIRGAEEMNFRGLLSYDALVDVAAIDFGSLLSAAREELSAFPDEVDAIIPHWDFPVSVISPVLAEELGLPAPSLESILKCEHKYWSRLEQRRSVPECTPGFAAFDPFDDDALDSIDLDFPFWVKPVKSHSSQLGFEIRDAETFAQALQEIREEIRNVGDSFDAVLSRVDLPPELEEFGGNACIAEELVVGRQIAPEGSVHRGRFAVHGLFDMRKDADNTSFDRLTYPAQSTPASVRERAIEYTRRYMEHIGFDNGCFNSEFIWDEDSDRLWLIEFNTRISQSHSDLFAKVDGVSNHQVAVDIALDMEPRMPRGEGEYAVAGQFKIFHDQDAVVTKVPDEDSLLRLRSRYPGTVATLDVGPGERLSEMTGQDSYRYVLGKLYLGASDLDELDEKYENILEELDFEFS